MTEATPDERRQAYDLFTQLIERCLIREQNLRANAHPTALAKILTAALWPYVSSDDQTVLDATIIATEIRNGAAAKTLTREQMITKCDDLLTRLRSNPKDTKAMPVKPHEAMPKPKPTGERVETSSDSRHDAVRALLDND